MPDNYAEENRYLYLNTPLGPDKLLMLTFNGYESLSEMYRFQIEAAAKKEETIKFDDIIGKRVSFGIVGTDDKDPRHFDGICIEFSEGVQDREFKYFTIVVVPKLWMTTQRKTCKIFQQKTVKEILQAVLTGVDTNLRLQGDYQPRDFCVQYNESDFDFASRLMEEEGIYYYFTFEEGSHTMVLGDNPQGHADTPGEHDYTFDTAGGGNRFADEERIGSWRRIQTWSAAKYTLWDHHFQLTDKHLDADKTIEPETVTAGTVTHKLKLSGNDAFEVYEYPGNYAKRYDGIDKGGGENATDLTKIFEDNKRTVALRMKQVATPDLVLSGASNCRRITAGHKFSMNGHFDGDGEYVAVTVSHTATEGDFRSGGDVNVEHYNNSFTAIPSSFAFLPSRKTTRPRVFGCQTAKVVGPPGEEIFTDRYGRVKVQFRWDRDGTEDSGSSCWLRVTTPWAGKNWGMINIPRVGQEVVVDFMEGDPDRPIVVGSVYNPDQMPPYPLPDNKTQSGMQSRSSKGGGAANCNEIKFEDKKGSEMVWVHGEKDMTHEVEHDESVWVGNDQNIIVDNNRTETVKGTEKVNVKGDRHNKLEGNHFEEYGQEHSLKIGQNHNMKVGMNHGVDAGMCISMKAGVNIVLEASVAITLKAGASSITISPAGIMISGMPLCLINTVAVAIPGIPVVCVPPIIVPLVPKIPPIPGAPNMPAAPQSGGPAAAALPSVAALPPLQRSPDSGAMASQVSMVLNSAVDSATQLVSGISSQLVDQSSVMANQLLQMAQQTEQAEEEAAKQVAAAIKEAVDDVKKQIQQSIAEAKDDVEEAIDEVSKEAQEELEKAADEVKELEEDAAKALDQLQQKMQQVANQAEQLAQQAIQEEQAMLAQAAQMAQNAAQQAQQLAQQAEQQLQQVAQQAEQMARNAENQARQEVNAVSQQLNALAQQASQGVAQVAQQVRTAVQQTDLMAQQALAQGEQSLAQGAQQARQAAQQGEQQAQQAAHNAQQAAQQAESNAAQQAQGAEQSVQNAAQQAGQQVQNTASQGQQQIANAASQSTQKAQEAGKLSEKAAKQVTDQVTNSASQASNQIGQAANQAYGQVGNAAGQAVSSVRNALNGLGN